jgi:uncharacterized Zn-binding protein involved in type VI secretion
MGALPAAYIGSVTQHGTPLVGVGSSNVTINGRAAWLAGAPHACAAHGPEMVGMGSETVQINSRRAVRANDGGTQAGDFLQGAGPPDQIMQGSPNVVIGTPAIGVATPANEALYCQLYCQLVHDWPTLTPAQRQLRYEAMLARMFATFGAPPPTTAIGLPAGSQAAFNRQTWQVLVGPNAWGASPPPAPAPTGPPAGGTTLHEIRHGEQAFLAMRHARGTGPSDALPSARAAAAGQPVNPNSPEGRMGSLHNDNEIAAPGFANRDGIIREVSAAANSPGGTASPRYAAAFNAYYNQPGGADARTVETAGNCGGCP